MNNRKQLLYSAAFHHKLVACDLISSNATIKIAEMISDMPADDMRQPIREVARYVGVSEDNLLYFPLAEHEELVLTTTDNITFLDDAIESVKNEDATVLAVVILSDGCAVFGRRST